MAGISQLELAGLLGVSQRHVSFVETGAARPSRELLMKWMVAAKADPWLWNVALNQAGYVSEDLDQVEPLQEQALDVLTQMVQAHSPCPGIVFDSDWFGLMQSEAGWWLCEVIMPEFMRTQFVTGKRLDMIAAATHDGGLLSQMKNGREFGEALYDQLSVETFMRPSLAPRVRALRNSLERRFGNLQHGRRPPSSPVLFPSFATDVGEMNFFTVQCFTGLPTNVNSGSVRVELWFPSDDATRKLISVRSSHRGPETACSE
jgi:transcriptional regulator with XRE-family HTH domain